MENNIYDVDFFINKFSKTPAKKWAVGQFENEIGQCCANGLCGVRGPDWRTISESNESKALQKVFSVLRLTVHGRAVK